MTKISGVGKTREGGAQVIEMWRWCLPHYNRGSQVNVESDANALTFSEKLIFTTFKNKKLSYLDIAVW